MKIEFFTIDELNYFKEHCDFTEDELYLLDEKSKGKTLEETGFDIDTLKSVKRKIRKALEDRETKTMTVAEIIIGRERQNDAIELVKWIRDISHGMVRYQCANCKGFKTLAYNYCPDCGAKMDIIKTDKEIEREEERK